VNVIGTHDGGGRGPAPPAESSRLSAIVPHCALRYHASADNSDTIMPRPVFLGEFEQLVLSALLLIEGEPYALRLREEVERVTGRSVSRGALYRTLDRLQRKGYVAVSVEKGGHERRGYLRRRFRVTAAGRATLRAARDAWMGIWSDLARVLR